MYLTPYGIRALRRRVLETLTGNLAMFTDRAAHQRPRSSRSDHGTGKR
jgi:hypothetical protein